MIGRRRTKITVENHRVLVIRRLGSTQAWCPECEAETDMVRPEEALALVHASQAQLADIALDHHWHVIQDHDGRLLVCLQSVLKAGF